MTIRRLILRELLYRRTNSLLGLLAITAAVACLIGTMAVLRGHDVETERILSERRTEVETQNKLLGDFYRKKLLELGFNVFVVPKDVDPAKLHEAGLGGKEMPQSHVKKLAEAGILTIDHLLPSLSATIVWPEQNNAQVILTGIHGEVAVAGKKRKRPLIQSVEAGEMVLGAVVAKRTGLKKDDQSKLLGREFKVRKVNPVRGTNADNTIWIDLTVAQTLLNKPGRITAIQAINCIADHCHPDETGIPAVDREIAKILPDTQVLIDMGKAKTRIDIRKGQAADAKENLAKAEQLRSDIKGGIIRFTSILVPLVIAGAGVWIALMMLINLRERRSEIGLLRALGVRAKTILAAFLGKAIVLGLFGAVIGSLIGLSFGTRATLLRADQLIDAGSMLLVFLAAPLLAVIASWIPAMLAAQQDPAVVLSEE